MRVPRAAVSVVNACPRFFSRRLPGTQGLHPFLPVRTGGNRELREGCSILLRARAGPGDDLEQSLEYDEKLRYLDSVLEAISKKQTCCTQNTMKDRIIKSGSVLV